MTRRRVVFKFGLLSGLLAPVTIFQQGCAIDPDLYLNASMQVLYNTLVFGLNNLTYGLM